jgi:hypothetical protein
VASATDGEARGEGFDGSAAFGEGDLLSTGEVGAREAGFCLGDVGEGAVGDDITALDAGSWSEVDDGVCGSHGIFVVFDDEDGISGVTEAEERGEEAVVIAWVEADGGFIEDVEDADESCADLGSEPDALGFAAGEGGCRPVEREVFEADIGEEGEAGAEFLEEFFRDAVGEGIEGLEMGVRLGYGGRIRLGEGIEDELDLSDGEASEFGEGETGDEDGASAGVETGTGAGGAGPGADEGFEGGAPGTGEGGGEFLDEFGDEALPFFDGGP